MSRETTIFIVVMATFLLIGASLLIRKKEHDSAPPPHSEVVDFGKECVPLNSDEATSLLMRLALKGGMANMNWDDRADHWELRVGKNHVYTGKTQMEALLRAKEELLT